MGSNDWSDWLFFIIALWVYFDATHHKIGKTPGSKSLLNMTAGGWATAASITYLGAIAVALYLRHRQQLIEQARHHPVRLSLWHRIAVAFLLLVLPMGVPYLLPPASGSDAAFLVPLLLR